MSQPQQPQQTEISPGREEKLLRLIRNLNSQVQALQQQSSTSNLVSLKVINNKNEVKNLLKGTTEKGLMYIDGMNRLCVSTLINGKLHTSIYSLIFDD
jgi:hypothetical protein